MPIILICCVCSNHPQCARVQCPPVFISLDVSSSVCKELDIGRYRLLGFRLVSIPFNTLLLNRTNYTQNESYNVTSLPLIHKLKESLNNTMSKWNLQCYSLPLIHKLKESLNNTMSKRKLQCYSLPLIHKLSESLNNTMSKWNLQCYSLPLIHKLKEITQQYNVKMKIAEMVTPEGHQTVLPNLNFAISLAIERYLL